MNFPHGLTMAEQHTIDNHVLIVAIFSPPL